jgi:hypothetical protein
MSCEVDRHFWDTKVNQFCDGLSEIRAVDIARDVLVDAAT